MPSNVPQTKRPSKWSPVLTEEEFQRLRVWDERHQCWAVDFEKGKPRENK